MTPPELAALLQPDGSVVIPAGTAGEVLRCLVRDLTAQAREHGGQASPAARLLLSALFEAAQQDEARPSTDSSAIGTVPAGCVTVKQAAQHLECSPRWVRHLAGRGVIKAERAGRAWLIDRQSLDDYRRNGRSGDDGHAVARGAGNLGRSA